MNKENWEGGNKAENKLEKLLENEKVRKEIDAKGKCKGPLPLAWSHCMFIIASKELGYLD